MFHEYGSNIALPMFLALVAGVPAVGAQTRQLRVPESLHLEHKEIHEALARATKVADPVGAAARDLAKVLEPHFVREEQIALPPLGLLAPLARGDSIADAHAVLAMTDTLRAELPSMLEQHKVIRAATMRLREAAHAARNAEVEELAHKLALHAQNEEEVTYPAAVLVGEIVRNRQR